MTKLDVNDFPNLPWGVERCIKIASDRNSFYDLKSSVATENGNDTTRDNDVENYIAKQEEIMKDLLDISNNKIGKNISRQLSDLDLKQIRNCEIINSNKPFNNFTNIKEKRRPGSLQFNKKGDKNTPTLLPSEKSGKVYEDFLQRKFSECTLTNTVHEGWSNSSRRQECQKPTQMSHEQGRSPQRVRRYQHVSGEESVSPQGLNHRAGEGLVPMETSVIMDGMLEDGMSSCTIV